MTPNFFEFYEKELQHIREMADGFAAEHEAAAHRLSLRQDDVLCPDPFVERLLEGFAFLTARVQMKLAAEFPTFTQGIMETVYPEFIAPLPCATVVQYTPKWGEALNKGVLQPRGSELTIESSTGVTCSFRTAHDVRLYPFQVAEAEYHLDDFTKLNLPTTPPAAFRIRLRLQGATAKSFRAVECDQLTFYLHGKSDAGQPGEILENLLSYTQKILVTAPADSGSPTEATWLPKDALRHAGFREDEALLPVNARSYEGHRILREHFLLPQRNLFLEVGKLRDALAKIDGPEVDLIFVLSQPREFPKSPLAKDLVQLYCTPAINLFPKTSSRIRVAKDVSKFQIISDRGAPLNHEIFSVQQVKGFGRSTGEGKTFHPFYLRPARDPNWAGFYSVTFEPKLLSEKEQKEIYYSEHFDRHYPDTLQAKYRGAEAFLTMYDAKGEEMAPAVEELEVQALCTNRHHVLGVTLGGSRSAGDFKTKNAPLVVSVNALTNLSEPQAACSEDRDAWRAISHLSLNYLSLVENGGKGVKALRAMLRLYTRHAPADHAAVEAIQSIESKPAHARSPGGGPISFIRGIEIRLSFRDSYRKSTRVFPLASALEQFFARHVSINHFTRLILCTENGKEIMRWPVRPGKTPLC